MAVCMPSTCSPSACRTIGSSWPHLLQGILVGRPRDGNDRVAWLVERGRYAEALAVAEEDSTGEEAPSLLAQVLRLLHGRCKGGFVKGAEARPAHARVPWPAPLQWRRPCESPPESSSCSLWLGRASTARPLRWPPGSSRWVWRVRQKLVRGARICNPAVCKPLA